jgi:hypothetical protein
MNIHQKWPGNPLGFLLLIIVLLSGLATCMGIFSIGGEGSYEYQSIRGKTVTIYGKGLYRHMSAEVAPQGIAQDYVTLLIGIPLLVISFFKSRSGSLRARYLLAGTLGYFLVTYLFYTVMGMYNEMFLVYVALAGASFYAFLMTILSFEPSSLKHAFDEAAPLRAGGIFLIITTICIAMLWLSIVVPPLLDGSIIPVQVEHYTTLIVQGLDLGILLPAAFISGVSMIRKKPFGYLFGPVYLVFLSLLMTALSAKLVAMNSLGYPVVPAIFIIPVFNLAAVIFSVVILKNINDSGTGS